MKKTSLLFLFSFFICVYVFSENFTIAVIPDSQKYVHYKMQYDSNPPYSLNCQEQMFRQMDYIAANSIKNGGNISFALHVGDFVNYYSKEKMEWELADKGMSILDGEIPYAVTIGNHDYDKQVVNKSSGDTKKNKLEGGRTFIKYFGPESSHFKNKIWYKGFYNGGMDSYYMFDTPKGQFLVLSLEIEPSDEVLFWAKRVIEENQNIPTILLIHKYIEIGYDKYSPGQAYLYPVSYRKGFPANSSKEVFEKLVKPNNQIFLILCGHSFKEFEGESVRTDVNDKGYKIYSILSDYQGRNEICKNNGLLELSDRTGDGWMRLLDFDFKNNFIQVRTYSTEFKIFEKDTNSDFKIYFDFDWNERFFQQ